MKMRAVKNLKLMRHFDTNMYSFHGPVVERPHTIKGGASSFPDKDIFLNLGSLHDKMKMRAVKISEPFRIKQV
jgi:hypothetical protein